MTTFTWNRALAPVALLSFLAVAQVGCAVDTQSDTEEVSSDSDAISSWKCDVSSLGTDRCQAALADVRDQAGAVGRSEIIERGIGWLEDGNLYQRDGAYHDGYRRDCSGFVSMAWQFTKNPSTALFPPFVSGEYAVALPGFDDLVPGDAVNRTYRKPYGHVMLFAGWASADHSELYFMHHSATGKPVSLIQMSRAQLADFTPIRSINAPDPTQGAAPPADQTPPPPPADQTPPPPPAETPKPIDGCGALRPGQSLGVNQAAVSCDGRFSLVQQDDGNLVLYQAGVGPLWSSGTFGTSANLTVMQNDGNLVSYTPSLQALWYTKTDGHANAWLSIGDDGSLIMHDGGALIWWSGTGGK